MAACLRCQLTELKILPSPEGITFYQCPSCGRQFAQKPGKSLIERWLGPLSLVLHPVIFSEQPQDDALRVATMLRSQQTADRRAIIVSEIRSEIAHPTQNVRDILDLGASEKDLREFLSGVAEILSTSSLAP
jgi:hypothetical protein